jgi:Leucine-rich repeat (LRR) protein
LAKIVCFLQKSNIKFLNFSNNGLGSASVVDDVLHIIALICDMANLRDLDLSDNNLNNLSEVISEKFGDVWAFSAWELSSMRGIEKVNLGGNCLSSKQVAHLVVAGLKPSPCFGEKGEALFERNERAEKLKDSLSEVYFLQKLQKEFDK